MSGGRGYWHERPPKLNLGARPWHTDEGHGRVIYDAGNNLIGYMDTAHLALLVVRTVNSYAPEPPD